MRRIRVNIKGRWYAVEVTDSSRNPIEVTVNGERFLVEVDSPATANASPQQARRIVEQTEVIGLRGIVQSGEKVVRCPMPGRIVAVSVRVGQQVKEGEEVCVLETMKMEQSVRLSVSGTVKEIFIQPGQSVQTAAPIIELE